MERAHGSCDRGCDRCCSSCTCWVRPCVWLENALALVVSLGVLNAGGHCTEREGGSYVGGSSSRWEQQRGSLTLWPVAGLSVAALHRGGHQGAAALMHGVQLPLRVRADHLPIPRAGSTAPRTLPGKDTALILREHQPQQQANILLSSPGPSPPHATS